VTRNVRHFGHLDLKTFSMSAVNPDLFLACALTSDVYRRTLEAICSARSREPRTPESLHLSLAGEHPELFESMRGVFPGPPPAPPDRQRPAESFRSVRCVRCGATPVALGRAPLGLCADCAADVRAAVGRSRSEGPGFDGS
jgi:hypothetical protein